MFRKRPGEEPPELPQRTREAEVDVPETVIAHGSTVHGSIQGRNTVRIAGFLEGQISIGGLAWIERPGEVQGTVTAREVIVEGQVRGDIESSGKIDIRASGRILGNLRCVTLIMAEGCFVHGEIRMPGDQTPPLTPVKKGQSAEDEPKTGA